MASHIAFSESDNIMQILIDFPFVLMLSLNGKIPQGDINYWMINSDLLY